MSDDKIQFSKPALAVPDQLQLLMTRGLIVEDIPRATHYLGCIGYYRLSGYFRYFSDPADVTHEKFYKDITFDRILDLYIFDRDLRNLVGDALERIEIAVKASMSNSCSLIVSPFWMCDAANFNYGQHAEIIAILDDAISPGGEKHKHIFLKHFFAKYTDPHPPSWIVMEALSFGAFSKIFKLSKGALRIPVARDFKVQHDILESWLHSLVFVRNVCAHFSRLWNRTFTITPKIPKEYKDAWPDSSQDKLYVICCIINHMMSVIADGSTWKRRLLELVRSRPGVPLKAMGFPDDWEDHPFWRFH